MCMPSSIPDFVEVDKPTQNRQPIKRLQSKQAENVNNSEQLDSGIIDSDSIATCQPNESTYLSSKTDSLPRQGWIRSLGRFVLSRYKLQHAP